MSTERELKDQLAQFEAEGKYYEAEQCKKKLKSLKARSKKNSIKATAAQHEERLYKVETVHEEEMARIMAEWQTKISTYEEQTVELREAMDERHSHEYAQYSEELRAKPRQPKFSVQLLNMRRIEQSLARQQKYKEAQEVQMRADILEEWERQKHDAEEDKRMSLLEEQYQSKQTLEMGVLQKKISSGRDELVKKMKKDIAVVERRYQNVLTEMQHQQELEMTRATKNTPSVSRGGRKSSVSQVDSIVRQYINAGTLSPKSSSQASAVLTLTPRSSQSSRMMREQLE
ncbi:hypothetical protein KIPB_009475 [Kipferlia bialata]|uniref:Uncharacterized protein n=1 Tax=Kipferlia bialata TaxID=797122 RepID=A0A9K3D1Q5_9EUKA|nr:hypothetical protein KIPB_009475 [Kipferlia bialata]|eukprot:g9475.t1